jgi:hypothetical protein
VKHLLFCLLPIPAHERRSGRHNAAALIPGQSQRSLAVLPFEAGIYVCIAPRQDEPDETDLLAAVNHHNSILKLGRRDKCKADLVLYLKIRRSVLYERGRRGGVQR